MLVRHRDRSPSIDPRAMIAPGAIISGDVRIGPDVCVLAGAVITSEGAPVTIGASTIIMEQAVVRGAGAHACTIGDHVMIGPHAHISGATVGSASFIATGAAIFNGAAVEEECLVAINGIVHIAATCPRGTVVPMGHIAVGSPARIYAPHEAPQALAEIGRLGFTRIVFGFDSASMTNGDATRALCERYLRALRQHADDEVLPVSSTPAALPPRRAGRARVARRRVSMLVGRGDRDNDRDSLDDISKAAVIYCLECFLPGSCYFSKLLNSWT